MAVDRRAVPQPDAYPEQGRYPAAYAVRDCGDAVTVTLEGSFRGRGGRTARSDHANRDGGPSEDALRRRPDERLVRVRTAASSHHDEVDVVVVGVLQYLLLRDTGLHDRLAVDAALVGQFRHRGDEFPALLLHPTPRLPDVARHRHEARVPHVHHVE